MVRSWYKVPCLEVFALAGESHELDRDKANEVIIGCGLRLPTEECINSGFNRPFKEPTVGVHYLGKV